MPIPNTEPDITLTEQQLADLTRRVAEAEAENIGSDVLAAFVAGYHAAAGLSEQRLYERLRAEAMKAVGTEHPREAPQRSRGVWHRDGSRSEDGIGARPQDEIDAALTREPPPRASRMFDVQGAIAGVHEKRRKAVGEALAELLYTASSYGTATWPSNDSGFGAHVMVKPRDPSREASMSHNPPMLEVHVTFAGHKHTFTRPLPDLESMYEAFGPPAAPTTTTIEGDEEHG